MASSLTANHLDAFVVYAFLSNDLVAISALYTHHQYIGGFFLVHHAIALGLHVTTLVLLKGAMNARSSKLMPDKRTFGYGFPCDGPGRGGTCDILAFDSFYLAVFWMLNTIGWVTFYWHWKHLALASGNVS